MLIYYSDTFPLPLPPKHHFPGDKYQLLRERVQAAPEAGAHELVEAPRVTRDELATVHDTAYVDAFCAGGLDAEDQRRIGLPWSPELAERCLRSCGATVAAARSALHGGAAVYLAGGTHHAHRDRGAGYCVFNDCAVAARVLQRESSVENVLIVDTDVHHGDGTAALFAADPTVFTFSLHGAKNYPRLKPPSDLDIALPDGATDGEYLAALAAGLRESFERFVPDFVFWLAGADPWEGDRLGRLAVTKVGLAERDRAVLGAIARAGVPWAVVMGGGYAPDIGDTVDVYFTTVVQALEAAPHGARSHS